MLIITESELTWQRVVIQKNYEYLKHSVFCTVGIKLWILFSHYWYLFKWCDNLKFVFENNNGLCFLIYRTKK